MKIVIENSLFSLFRTLNESSVDEVKGSHQAVSGQLFRNHSDHRAKSILYYDQHRLFSRTISL